MELPLGVEFAGFSVGIAAWGGIYRLFGWNCRVLSLEGWRVSLAMRGTPRGYKLKMVLSSIGVKLGSSAIGADSSLKGEEGGGEWSAI